MHIDLSLFRFRMLALLAAAALSIALAACGDDDDEGEGEGAAEQAEVIRIAAKDGEQPTVSTERVNAGLVEITLESQGKKRHDAQLFKVVGDHSPAEVISTINRVVQNNPLPDWLFAGGGVGPTPGGESQSVIQVLEPATYYVADIEGGPGPPTPATVARFVVSGDAGDAEVPSEEATVRAIEYAFEADSLEAGENRILFENAGAQPHHLIAAPIAKGSTIEDVRRFVRTEKGKPPIDERGSVTTAVLEGQTSQVVTLDLLKPGSYALLCFISDRQGGPPHALQGMISEATVR